ncbi:MAG: Bax inhibitor-1/YccA family protein [Ignavibacteriae bacterium]|nr:Bax inhibitor-1/YccA family protein [Ignavibacteriota bacterium]
MVRRFMLAVYNWMTLGLGLTAIVAFGVGRTSLVNIILNTPGLFWGIIIVQFLVVIGMSALMNKIPSIVAIGLFFLYALLTGVTFSILFLIYTESSIAFTFFTCAAMFGGISIFGYITKIDLTAIGGFLMMGLFGLIIASVVNIFLHSSTIYWITSYAGVIIFVGLTAWDTQRIKKMGMFMDSSSEDGKKAAIFGALMLYLDFVNLFLYLLRFMGSKK